MFGRTRSAVRAQLESTGLPDALRDFIASLVARTRLRRAEQLDIAAELASHFSEGLATGKSVDRLLASYGDEKQSARELRAGAIAKRGALDRAAGTLVKWSAVGLAAMLAVYLGSATVIYLREPVISFDAVAALNAGMPKPGAEGRAFDLYAAAMSDAKGASRREWIAEKFADADEAASRLDTDPSAVVVVRRALEELKDPIGTLRGIRSRPAFGMPLGPAALRDEAAVRFFGAEVLVSDGTTTHGPLSDSLLTVLLPQLSILRQCGRMLCLDARVAALDGRGDDAIASLEAAAMCANHAGEPAVLVSALVKNGLQALVIDTVRDAVDRSPRAFTDAQLDRLERLVREQRNELAVGVEGERMMLRDVIQRCYSDDGKGDGVLLPRAWGRLLLEAQLFGVEQQTGGVRAEALPGLDFLMGPLSTAVLPSRRETEARLNQYFDALAAALSASTAEESEMCDKALAEVAPKGDAGLVGVAEILLPDISGIVKKRASMREAAERAVDAIARERAKRLGAPASS